MNQSPRRFSGAMSSVIIAAPLVSPRAFARNIIGEIDCVANVSSGTLVPGAKVVITNRATNQLARIGKVNDRGEYWAAFW